jgi:hypothetical protein
MGRRFDTYLDLWLAVMLCEVCRYEDVHLLFECSEGFEEQLLADLPCFARCYCRAKQSLLLTIETSQGGGYRMTLCLAYWEARVVGTHDLPCIQELCFRCGDQGHPCCRIDLVSRAGSPEWETSSRRASREVAQCFKSKSR